MLEGLSPEAAVCVDPAHVAFVAVRDGHVRLGDDVAVFGLGAIGLLTVQAARASGASRVVAIDPLARRRERALAMGATAGFDPTVGDVALTIKEATGRRGVDVALETSGVDGAVHEAIRCIRQCGTVVVVGWGRGTGAGLYLGEEFHVNRPTIVASQAASYWGNPDRDYPSWDEPRAQRACAELFARGVFSPRRILDPIIDLEEAPEVMEAVRSNPSTVLKVGIRVGS
jgi:threonine dehydrogenase-like Zn-dependent dehydrogenase